MSTDVFTHIPAGRWSGTPSEPEWYMLRRRCYHSKQTQRRRRVKMLTELSEKRRMEVSFDPQRVRPKVMLDYLYE
jgi:hypothetical protein